MLLLGAPPALNRFNFAARRASVFGSVFTGKLAVGLFVSLAGSSEEPPLQPTRVKPRIDSANRLFILLEVPEILGGVVDANR